MTDTIECDDLQQEPLVVSGNSSFSISDEEFSDIRDLLLESHGFNLDAYKDSCVRRRIAIRIRATHCQDVRQYCDHLISHKPEVDSLLKVLTIHVSQFFRNPSLYEKISREIFPKLFAAASKRGAKSLRVWSLGCAWGEEPYSIALILAEQFGEMIKEIPVKIDATDVDLSTIEQARRGVYPSERLLELPELYRTKYFQEHDGQFMLADEIIRMVTFNTGDMLSDALYSNCDLLLCRNVLIYFSREQQEKVYRNISRVLNPDGYMILGKSETLLGGSRALFQTICPEERIYRPVITAY